MRVSAALLAMSLSAAVGLGAACKPDLIPGTTVENSAENREVIDFLAKYREAIVTRSPDAVVGLTTSDYFEDNGTIDQADDYGRDALRGKLESHFKQTKEIQLEIIVQQIDRPDGDDGPVRVAYRYNQRALVSFPVGDKWVTLSDVNRLVLRPDAAGGFLIASGL